MKIFKLLDKVWKRCQWLICAVIIHLFAINSYSQTNEPTGNRMQNPILVGSFYSSFQYSNTVNTKNYTDNHSRGIGYYSSANDVFYSFTLTIPMEITIDHCGSEIEDTYLYLLDALGNEIDRNDDSRNENMCPEGGGYYKSYLNKVLSPGTYYVLSEGYSQNGVISTSIKGETNITGNTFQKPIVVNSSNGSFQYTNSQNTVNFTNNYVGRPANDVYYKFVLATVMEVTINHCGSTLSDTYLHLLDASGNRIDYNDDYYGEGKCDQAYHSYMKKALPPGTYYVVSEGYSQNGIIQTNIEGKILRVEYYYDLAGNRISRRLPYSNILRALAQEEEPLKKENNQYRENIENLTFETIPGIENISNDKVVIFPNPTQGPLTIEILGYEDGVESEIKIINQLGKAIYIQKVTSMTTEIDLTGYAKGIYLIQVNLKGATIIHKIIKK